jgi:hypothetical protein
MTEPALVMTEPPLNAALLEHVEQLQLAVPQTLLPHLTSLLPDTSAAATGSSSSSSGGSSGGRLWRNVQTMQLCLEGDVLDEADSPFRSWPVPTQLEQQRTVQLLLRASQSLRVLRVQGSTRAEFTFPGQLAALSTAAAGTLEELHLLHAVPRLHEKGAIPFLHEFRQLRVLTLAASALHMTRLALHTLRPTLQQLHLEGFIISLELAPAFHRIAWREQYIRNQQHAAQHVQTTLAKALEAEQRQPDQPAAAAAAAPETAAAAHDAKAAAASATAEGQYAAVFMRREFEHIRAFALPPLVEVMPQLQRLHLINCTWYSAWTMSLALLLEWAGPCLQELVLADLHSNDRAAGDSDAESVVVPLPNLRRCDWVNCRLPVVTHGAAASLSQLLAFLQASAPQLQQLKVAAGKSQPLLDWHVPLLLRMQQLRRLEVYVGPDEVGELASRWAIQLYL